MRKKAFATILSKVFVDDFKTLKLVVSTVSKKFKINLEGQNYVHFEVILSRNVKTFSIMASL